MADIIEKLKEAEGQVDGDLRKTIHDAWNEILWMREAVVLSKRAVEIAESKVPPNTRSTTYSSDKPAPTAGDGSHAPHVE
jgi:hypothetical protein